MDSQYLRMRDAVTCAVDAFTMEGIGLVGFTVPPHARRTQICAVDGCTMEGVKLGLLRMSTRIVHAQ